MLKKTVLFIIAVICLVPSVSFANDAIPMYDKNNSLTVSLDLIDEAQIGKMFDFSVSIQNNTASPIDDKIYIEKIFSHEGSFDGTYYGLTEGINTYIAPHETLVLNLSIEIPRSIYWYKKAGNYYTDFELLLSYDAPTDKNKEDPPYGYTMFLNEPETIPLLLTNLKDGQGLLDLDIEPENYPKKDTLFFGCNYYYDRYLNFDTGQNETRFYQYLSCNLGMSMLVTNTSEYDIYNVYVNEPNYCEFDDDDFCNGTIKDVGRYKYDYNLSDMPSEHPINLKAVFMIRDEYYATEKTKTFKAEYVPMPELKISRHDDEEEIKLNFLNTGDNDYEVYILPDSEFSDHYDPKDVFDKYIINSNESLDLRILKTLFRSNNISLGIVRDDVFYYWAISYGYSTENDGLINIRSLDFDIYMPDITYDLSANTQPSEDIYANPYKPNETIAPEETPIHTPDISITVNSITKKPAVPFWVWIVLGCALLAAGILLYILGARRSKKEKD